MLTIPIKRKCGKHYSFDMKRTLMRKEKMLMMWKEHSLCEKNAHYSFDVKRNILIIPMMWKNDGRSPSFAKGLVTLYGCLLL